MLKNGICKLMVSVAEMNSRYYSSAMLISGSVFD